MLGSVRQMLVRIKYKVSHYEINITRRRDGVRIEFRRGHPKSFPHWPSRPYQWATTLLMAQHRFVFNGLQAVQPSHSMPKYFTLLHLLLLNAPYL